MHRGLTVVSFFLLKKKRLSAESWLLSLGRSLQHNVGFVSELYESLAITTFSSEKDVD